MYHFPEHCLQGEYTLGFIGKHEKKKHFVRATQQSEGMSKDEELSFVDVMASKAEGT